MKLRSRAAPERALVQAVVATGPDGKGVLIVDGEPHGAYDRRLRDLEVVSGTDTERSTLKRHGFRISGL